MLTRPLLRIHLGKVSFFNSKLHFSENNYFHGKQSKAKQTSWNNTKKSPFVNNTKKKKADLFWKYILNCYHCWYLTFALLVQPWIQLRPLFPGWKYQRQGLVIRKTYSCLWLLRFGVPMICILLHPVVCIIFPNNLAVTKGINLRRPLKQNCERFPVCLSIAAWTFPGHRGLSLKCTYQTAVYRKQLKRGAKDGRIQLHSSEGKNHFCRVDKWGRLGRRSFRSRVVP